MPYKDPVKKAQYQKDYWKTNSVRQNTNKRKRYSVIKDTDRFKARRRINQLKTKYGITFEELRTKYMAQGGSCDVCHHKFISYTDMYIDHNHSTGQVRGILCQSCNSMLGFSKDNTSILSKGIDYLNKWENMNNVCQGGF
jgi:5-methylcytosine-specific restriction endonuclease McrA